MKIETRLNIITALMVVSLLSACFLYYSVRVGEQERAEMQRRAELTQELLDHRGKNQALLLTACKRLNCFSPEQEREIGEGWEMAGYDRIAPNPFEE